MKLLKRDILKVLIFLSSVKSEIHKEVTDFGITLLRGSREELDNIQNDIAELSDQLDNNSRKRRSANPFSENFRNFIVRQIAENIDNEFRVDFNGEDGPSRGAYNMEAVDSKLYSTGLKKDAEEYGELPLPKSHYCRYRVPTEIDGDDDNCCLGENKKCYTEAGCFCDVSCYTKYGDCCTDHFVKCYQKLRLCLIAIDDDAAEKEAKEDMSSKKNVHVSKENHKKYSTSQDQFQATMMARSFGANGFMQHARPEDIKPNECCAQKPYHTEDVKDGKFPICCDGNLSWAPEGTQC